MFPFPWMSGCVMDATTRQKCRQAQVDCLKMVRDGLEARLAGVNAAIATLEHQQSRSATEDVVQSL
jgi:hypothetical protein